jgi:NAD+ synthase
VEKAKTNASTGGQMTPKQRINHIVRWLRQYARSARISTFVVGISGGIDSSVVSALCARTGLKTIVVQMPIRQNRTLDRRSSTQAGWLLEHHPETVTHISIDLTTVFSAFEKKVEPLCGAEEYNHETYLLASANSRARLRMMTLYQIAQCHGGIVVGTGNRVEDFGVGFFTKYGDGGVDISPIGDCLKTDVWDMGRELGLPQEIIDAAPTDGLWTDGRTDEDQLGMTYPELERMMALDLLKRAQAVDSDMPGSTQLTADDRKKLKRYQELRAKNMHKMQPIPVCKFDNN